MGGNATPSSRKGQSSRMVSRGVSGYPSLCFVVAQGKNSIARASDLESACFLEILALEEDLTAGHPVDRRGGQDRGSMDKRFDPPVCLSDVFQRRFCFHTESALS
jgi:hypothetical protein